MNVLALDVGGTNVRIALYEAVSGRLHLKKYKGVLTQEVKDLSLFVKIFDVDVDHACIGFAGPIIGDRASLTNAALKVDLKDFKQKTKIQNVSLMNDFHVAGYGVRFLHNRDFVVLNKGKGFNNDVHMVVGPGTGLGKAYIIEGKVHPCEGGLTALGVEDISDYALLDYLKSKYGAPIYYEDVVSGAGLIDIYDHLEIKSDLEVNTRIRNLIKEEPVNKAKIITKYSEKDRLCDMTLRIFTKFYARFVRDSALNLISSKVFLIGGISGAISPYLSKYFMNEFLRHRRYSSMLKKVNIQVILNPNVGLLGAAAVAGNLVKGE